jgi:hypothetical protein
MPEKFSGGLCQNNYLANFYNFIVMTKPIRIPITITEEELVILNKLMKQENRSRAQIATMIFQDGLKLLNAKTL